MTNFTDDFGSTEVKLVKKLDVLISELENRVEKVEKLGAEAKNIAEIHSQSGFVCKKLLPAMHQLRTAADELETIVSDEFWSSPSYRDLLFSV